MSKHEMHRIDNNSISAYDDLDLEGMEHKIREVYRNYAIVNNNESLTDRQVLKLIGGRDMNEVRPTITTLLDKGICVKTGDTICEVTNQTVRLVNLQINRPEIPLPKKVPPKLYREFWEAYNSMIIDSSNDNIRRVKNINEEIKKLRQ